MPSGTKDDYNAVFFMQDHKVTRQMRYSEFEAFLDGYIGLSDTLDQEVRIVFAMLTPEVKVHSLVFFQIYFDDQGKADSEWNVPLVKLAKKGASGPDMGAGPIHLVCRSRCPDPAYRDDLWDPGLTPGSNDITAIRRAVEENRLNFECIAPAEPDIPLLTQQAMPDAITHEAEHRKKVAGLLKEQRLRIKTLTSVHQDEIAETKRQMRVELQGSRRELDELRQKVEQLTISNENLKRRLNERSEQFMELQDALADRDRILASLEGERSDRAENDPLRAEMVIVKEKSERLEAEIERRHEVERDLRNQLQLVREEAARQMAGNELIDRFKDMGLFLVAFHPGAGHLTIPYETLDQYLADPLSFAAEKCQVDVDRYRRWLEHYEHPVCGSPSKKGDCLAPVMRVNNPTDFRTGIDDRCDAHRP